MDTTEQKPSLRSRLLWFVGIWTASVIVMTVVAYLLRWILIPS